MSIQNVLSLAAYSRFSEKWPKIAIFRHFFEKVAVTFWPKNSRYIPKNAFNPIKRILRTPTWIHPIICLYKMCLVWPHTADFWKMAKKQRFLVIFLKSSRYFLPKNSRYIPKNAFDPTKHILRTPTWIHPIICPYKMCLVWPHTPKNVFLTIFDHFWPFLTIFQKN